ncbi:MAG: hypothetical protein AAF662_02320 [Pseudomonadota bacterium]
MAILPTDVRLFEPQVLSDEDDGGGRATGNIIVDGVVNNLFPDISRLDRIVGDVALRKFFVGINTDNADPYLGVHAIINSAPADPNVNVLLFDAGSESDVRQDAQNRIESYVVRGGAAQFDLLGSQFEGQRTVVAYQREEQPPPEAGQVFLLDAGSGTEQYVRVTEVDTTIQTFTVSIPGGGFLDFERRRLDMGITAPLQSTFPGVDPQPAGAPATASQVFTTEVADAARYWGVKQSVDPVNIGDVQVKVDSIYSALVPSAQAESPLSDQPLYLGSPLTQASRASTISIEDVGFLSTSAFVLEGWLARSAVRGSVRLVIGTTSYVDDGAGRINRESGAFSVEFFTIDYRSGYIRGDRTTGGSGITDVDVTYQPAAPYAGRRNSDLEEITISNRGFTYVRSFPDAKPRPGSMIVSFQALGVWYTLEDRGDGVLEGFGSGTVRFDTGTVSITLDALPDVDSGIIWSYIVDFADEFTLVEGLLAENPEIEISIDQGAAPGSVVVTYTSGGSPQTLNDTAIIAELAGAGTGDVDYAGGIVRFKPDLIPDDGTTIDVAYDFAAGGIDFVTSPSISSGIFTHTISDAPVVPGSVTIELLADVPRTSGVGSYARAIRLRDDGLGNFIGVPGTIDYATGALNVRVERDYATIVSTMTGFTREAGTGRFVTTTPVTTTRTISLNETATGAVTVRFKPASASDAGGSTSVPFSTLGISLDDRNIPMVPGSLLFTWNGEQYFDRDGILYKNLDAGTGAATAVGSVDYNTAFASIDTWSAGSVPGIDIQAMLLASGQTTVQGVFLRTPGTPIRPGSFQITITDIDGNLISESAEISGEITGPSIAGSINVATGIIALEFTNGTDPIDVFPETGRYNAVLQTFLPLDAELIGLDPVRLPADGRVPVFRPGDVIVISQATDVPIGTPAAGAVIALGETNIAGVDVVDPNGDRLDPIYYTVDRLAGEVTFANPLVLETPADTPLVTPLVARYRVEHGSILNDVQISGELSFVTPTGFAFGAGATVSSAKVWGDVDTRVYNFFTQRTWNSGSPNWTSERIGDDTTANFNIIDNPIEVVNNGAITERWAIVFTGSTNFQVVGQSLGIIASSSTTTDLAPINPNTGNPYFVMRQAGFGAGWSPGNVIRFDTDGLLAPGWIARTVLAGSATEDEDEFVLEVRGDAD